VFFYSRKANAYDHVRAVSGCMTAFSNLMIWSDGFAGMINIVQHVLGRGMGGL